MTENIIEIVNTNYVLEIEDTTYDLQVENLIVSDYTNSANKPKINSVEVVGSKTSSDYGLVSSSDMILKENVANKTTVLASTSTDTQYPTAKSVYNKFLQKSNVDLDNLSQTAENHFANPDLSNLSSVGESHFANLNLDNLSSAGSSYFVKPDCSNISSVGQKVFDGQWVVLSTATTGIVVFSNTAVGTYTVDISSYLPDTDHVYTVWCRSAITRGSSSFSNIYLDTDLGMHYQNFVTLTGENNVAFWGVVTKTGILTIENTTAASANTLGLYAYRRIGTNV